MQISIQMQKNVLVVRLEGELDHHNAEDTKKRIEKEIYNKNPKNLLFDLSHLSFMDSSGIGMIIGRYKIICALGGKTSVVCKGKQIEKILTMSGIKKIIDVYSDEKTAIANF